MNNRRAVAQTAIDQALACARQNATTAALVMALVPLAAMPARAVLAISPVSVSTVFGTDANGPTVTYTFTNDSDGNSIDEIEIPEINAGDLKYSPFLIPSSQPAGASSLTFAPPLPYGWTGTQSSTSSLGATVPGLTPSDFLDLVTSDNTIGSGGSEVFTFDIPTSNTIEAHFVAQDTNATDIVIDPPIPNTSVPEPTSLALLGTALAGFLGTRRRRQKA